MKVYVYIQQKPLKVKTYTSLTALYEANRADLRVSKSTLDKYDFDSFPFITSRIIIAKTEPQSSGDVRRIVQEEYQKAFDAGEASRGEWKKAAEIIPSEHPSYSRLQKLYNK
ncbi:MAG: hypothetical protein LBQ74_03730 [Prevotella sp.]|jgi:hypothetical protein|nr:hypothetical protein [Prevotella sp.]